MKRILSFETGWVVTWALLGLFTCLPLANTVAAAADTAVEKTDKTPAEPPYKFWIALATCLIASAGGVVAVIGAWRATKEYGRANQWKRAEFLAKEMTAFFSDPDVENAFTMIDWDGRYMKLGDSDAPNLDKRTRVDRRLQISALRPHTLASKDFRSDFVSTEEESKDGVGFSPVQSRIRDSYDKLLDGLARFASYVEAGLIDKDDLDTYLKYWIDDIAGGTKDKDEAAWTMALFAYIEAYDFKDVKGLFAQYGHDISVGGDIFRAMRVVAADENFSNALLDGIKKIRANRLLPDTQPSGRPPSGKKSGTST